MELQNKLLDIINRFKKVYILYILSVIGISQFISLFYSILTAQANNDFSNSNILRDFITLIPFVIIHLSLSYLIYYRTTKEFSKFLENKFQSLFLNRLTYRTLVVLILVQAIESLFVCYFSFIDIANDPELKNSISIYWFVGTCIVYGFIVIPIFFCYILLTVFDQKIKKVIFDEIGLLYQPGNKKLLTDLLIAFVITGIFPYSIFLMNLINEIEKSIFEGNRVYIFGTLVIVLIGASISIFFFRKLINHPIDNLINLIQKVETGDLTQRVVVSKSNELSILSAKFNEMLDGLEEKEKIKDEFGKYLSPEVAKEILTSGKNIWDGEEKEVTILFTDIEGYSTISEKMEATEVVQLLNEYFTDLVQIITENNGVVNKFIGDAVLAIYNAPLDDKEHAMKAVKSALAILELNMNKRYRGNIQIKTRIGINTGKVVLGNLGSKIRQEYTVIGDTVNIAQRLESYNKESSTELLVSEYTYKKLNQKIPLKQIGEVKVKGREQSIIIYTNL
ncbi:MAG: adenylate/guanylate cyclase domain-containing protein [Leptospiraceae bacterium]|nr:adenylate/guanylate cyclase domain-containing protein [Leptospiraceae bacterium]